MLLFLLPLCSPEADTPPGPWPTGPGYHLRPVPAWPLHSTLAAAGSRPEAAPALAVGNPEFDLEGAFEATHGWVWWQGWLPRAVQPLGVVVSERVGALEARMAALEAAVAGGPEHQAKTQGSVPDPSAPPLCSAAQVELADTPGPSHPAGAGAAPGGSEFQAKILDADVDAGEPPQAELLEAGGPSPPEGAGVALSDSVQMAQFMDTEEGTGTAPHGSEFQAKILDEELFTPQAGPGAAPRGSEFTAQILDGEHATPLAGPGVAPHRSEFKAKILDEEGFSPPASPGEAPGGSSEAEEQTLDEEVFAHPASSSELAEFLCEEVAPSQAGPVADPHVPEPTVERLDLDSNHGSAASTLEVEAAVWSAQRWTETRAALEQLAGGAEAVDALLLALRRLRLEAGDGPLPASAASDLARVLATALPAAFNP